MSADEPQNIAGFEWDGGNVDKNYLKHGVSNTEAEEVFFDDTLIVFEDVEHSQHERRYRCLGKTDKDRKLFVFFTVRNSKIRIISVRDMNKKE